MREETETEQEFESGSAAAWIRYLTDLHFDTALWFVENGIEPRGGVEGWIGDTITDGSESEIDTLRSIICGIAARGDLLTGRQLKFSLRDAKSTEYNPIEWQDANEPMGQLPPQWPTGCAHVDDLTEGGGYGFVVYAGQPKVGKSLLAISSAIEAARDGWRVVYGNAEMSRSQMIHRLRNRMGKLDDRVVENLHIANLSTGINVERFYHEVCGVIEDNDQRLLIVLDSINRVVDAGLEAGSDGAYWKLLRDWSAWAMNSRRSTEGDISWLIVSELNARGDVKGRSLEYTADVVVRLKSTEVPDVVEIDVPYSRSTRAAHLGTFLRDFSRGAFVKGD